MQRPLYNRTGNEATRPFPDPPAARPDHQVIEDQDSWPAQPDRRVVQVLDRTGPAEEHRRA
jgi:hypothetical protein